MEKADIKKALSHFKTITLHRTIVCELCIRAGIPVNGLLHDLSKYSPTEFLVGAKYYQGTRSPNARERELFGYSSAWMHHKGRNRHHYEYWSDLNIATGQYEPVRMPVKYFIEMICDRIAASKVYYGKDYTDSKSYEYFCKERERSALHPDTRADLEYYLLMLCEHGEEYTLNRLRRAALLGKTRV